MTRLNQVQTEALIRLLIAAKYADRLLSVPEDESFASRVADLPWDSAVARELFVKSAFAQVREARSSPEGRALFLRDQCAHFDTPETRRRALDHLEALIRADGIGEGEEAFLKELRELFANQQRS